MNVTLQQINIEASDSLKSLINKKVKKLDKYLRADSTVCVTLSLEGKRETCEITMPCAGVIVRAEETTDDIYTSLDGAIAKIERRVEKFRTKLEKRYRGGQNTPEYFADLAGGEDDEESNMPPIVRTKRFAVKPQTLEEAVMQLQLLGHDFYVFRNAQSDEVNVLYKRHDGNLALIEPTYEED